MLLNIIRPTVMSVLVLAIIDGYVLISIIFIITKLFAVDLVITPLSYLSLFILSSLLAMLYLLKCKIELNDKQLIFYNKQIFINIFKVKIDVQDINLINSNFHKDRYNDLNFISFRANKIRYRIPIRSYKEAEVLDFIEKINMSKIV